MWKLIKLEANNLCAFKELKYNIHQGVTTLIFGHNLDNDSQGSNGSGKSALLEAVAIGIVGETLRPVKTDEIINDQANEANITVYLFNDNTNETLVIERSLFRKSAQQIHCTIETKDESKDMVQSSVAEYNRFILETIGLTKEDIYSSFILSKHKYTSFLSSSDKEKKELINRFSNGIMVDESISQLEQDVEPIQDEMKECESRVANINGKVSAITDQINSTINDTEERQRSKTVRIEKLNDSIADKRADIRNLIEQMTARSKQLGYLDAAYSLLQKLEASEKNAEECYPSVVKIMADVTEKQLTDWQGKIDSVKKRHSECKAEMNTLSIQLKDLQSAKEAVNGEYEKALEEDKKAQKDFNNDIAKVDVKLTESRETFLGISDRIKSIAASELEIKKTVRSLENAIAGSITCPKCSHVFVLDCDIDVEKTKQEIIKHKESLSELTDEIVSQNLNLNKADNDLTTFRVQKARLQSQQDNYESKAGIVNQKIRKLTFQIDDIEYKYGSLKNTIKQIVEEANGVRQKMFDEAFNMIDDFTSNAERVVKRCENDIEVAKGSIETFEKSIEEIKNIDDSEILNSLKKSKAGYEQDLNKAISMQDTVQCKLNKYTEQIARFTEFKTHLANTKITALGDMTNDFLEQIGSDIRIKFSGYTVLKSGKVRDKISISLVRDGVDCGSFGKFSEGEKVRVNLANILALHNLMNLNTDDDKGLDLLVLDEILEATDENGLANMFDALNKLKITSLVVTHSLVQESYPYKIVVNKQSGISTIN